jgi:myo-inositol 2-dehydrogenase / D-chiro-inositol 1-dehydrogenase
MSSINRRRFLQSLAVAGVAPLILPSRVFGESGANARINLGAIGCGRMGRTNIGNTIAAADRFNARFIAVCDVDRNRLRQTASMIKSRVEGTEDLSEYTDYRELLSRDDIDAVVISTPDHSHGMIALAAIRAGKDVYVEKPLTFGVKEGRELVQAVRQHGRILQVGSQQRSSVHFRRVCELARSGRLGRLETIEVGLPMDSGHADPAPMETPNTLDYDLWLQPGRPFPYSEFRVHPRQGYGRPGFLQVASHCRGMITGWGSHMVDNAIWGMGLDDKTPFTVKGSADFPDRGLFDVHTNLHAELTFPDGLVMKITCDAQAQAGVRFNGSEGWAHAWRGRFEASERSLLQEADPSTRILAVSNNHQSNWLESIRSRQDPIAPVDEGHLTNNLCVAALAACQAAGGRELAWNPLTEEFSGHAEANKILNL